MPLSFISVYWRLFAVPRQQKSKEPERKRAIKIMSRIKRNPSVRPLYATVIAWLFLAQNSLLAVEGGELFSSAVAPIFERRCLHCHNDNEPKGKLSLTSSQGLLAGGESGPAIEPGDSDASLLIDYIAGDDPEMPKDEKPLSAKQVEAIRQWIAAGAKWPQDFKLVDKSLADTNWWSLLTIHKPPLPKLSPGGWA